MQLIVNDEIADLHSRLAQIGQKLGNTTPVMAAIGALLESSTRERFATSTAPDGSAWKALSPVSRMLKRRNKSKPLVEFGDLMRSITHHASAATVVVGTDRHYGQYHQTGAQKADGSQKIPARPFLGLSAADKTGINDLLNDFLQGAIHG